jgi:pimeloyl-ACP methyl ester carboxylesterase
MSLAMEMETENSQKRNRRLLTMLKYPGLRAGGFASLMQALCLVSLGGCAWLDTKQRQLIYRPTPGVPAHFTGLRNGDEQYFPGGFRPPELARPMAAGPSVKRPPLRRRPSASKCGGCQMPTAARPLCCICTAPSAPWWLNVRKIEALRTAGFSVLAVEYRGWGLSTPITPSEQTILQDADVAWAEFQRREPRADRRVIFGHSMGSGVAVDLASRQRPQSDYAGLILESAFTSFPDIALEVSSVAWLLSKTSDERFASIDKIKRVEQPLLMIHGNLDKTVPMVLGEKLFAAANPPKQWVMIEGGKHSDLDEAGRAQYQQGGAAVQDSAPSARRRAGRCEWTRQRRSSIAGHLPVASIFIAASMTNSTLGGLKSKCNSGSLLDSR